MTQVTIMMVKKQTLFFMNDVDFFKVYVFVTRILHKVVKKGSYLKIKFVFIGSSSSSSSFLYSQSAFTALKSILG